MDLRLIRIGMYFSIFLYFCGCLFGPHHLTVANIEVPSYSTSLVQLMNVQQRQKHLYHCQLTIKIIKQTRLCEFQASCQAIWQTLPAVGASVSWG